MKKEQVVSLVHDVSKKAGIPMVVPVQINPRLTSTLGRVMYKNCMPTKIEFSKSFIESESDDNIKEVIIHEVAHYVAMVRTNMPHGHDSYFKSVVKELGGKEETGKSTFRTSEAVKAKHKYTVYCPNCKKVVANYSAFRGKITHLETCTCGKCGGGSLYYVQNY